MYKITRPYYHFLKKKKSIKPFFFFLLITIVSCRDASVNNFSSSSGEADKEASQQKILPAARKSKVEKENDKRESEPIGYAEKALDQINRLAETKPVSFSALKAWLPNQLGVYKRTYFSTGEMAAADVIAINSRFTNQKEQTKVVSIKVTDGAGSALAGLLVSSLQRNIDISFEEEMENSYKKVVEKKGIQAMEEQDKEEGKASLEYIEHNRFHIRLEGQNLSPEELWDIASILPTEKLDALMIY